MVPRSKSGKKKANKALKKREKAEDREMEANYRKDRDKQVGEKQAKYSAKLAAKEAERLGAEDEEKKVAEAKAEEEQKEFDKWKDMFAVEDEGDADADLDGESSSLLNDFITYIKNSKMVVLEDCAAKFGLHTKEVINRIQNLEEMGRLGGVLDDRGKYIYISEEEWAAVAKFVNARGRVSMSMLAKESNKLIDMTPRELEEDKALDAELEGEFKKQAGEEGGGDGESKVAAAGAE